MTYRSSHQTRPNIQLDCSDCGHCRSRTISSGTTARDRHPSVLAWGTKLAFYQNDLVGYISLLSDSIVLHESERKWFEAKNFPIRYAAALKIGRLGTQNKYKGQGIGTALMKYAVGVAFRMNEMGVGCRFLTLDSDKAAIPFYLRLGFVFSQHRDYKKKDYPNMHYDLDELGRPSWIISNVQFYGKYSLRDKNRQDALPPLILPGAAKETVQR